MMEAPQEHQTPHSAIGFEGYEKRIEITFSKAPAYLDPCGYGLRALSRHQIDSFLDAAKCTIVSQLSNDRFDSYVLSESSLFVYPLKIILKTCGTTKLLLAIPRILDLAAVLSLPILSVKYSRGSFIFPDAQPSPHRSFAEEVDLLNMYLGNIVSDSNAYVMGDPDVPNRNWHVYYASREPEQPMVTLEMCMTGLNETRASVFFKESSSDRCAKDMTKLSGISEIMPEMQICDFEFDPCGYSMNGIHGNALSTIHVTPEDGFSYASYEAQGFDPFVVDYAGLIGRVLRCFQPSEFSVALTISGGRDRAASWGKWLGVNGYVARDSTEQELSNGGLLLFQSFSAGASSPYSTLCSWESEQEENSEEEEEWGLA